ncbi:hypothetical protein [Paraburkholderia diazotrophica]|uniref:hypothetical protein n=1 Tax=Paraburkholderia diazotrophica TaxID=667676 RepID=UPI003179C5A9
MEKDSKKGRPTAVEMAVDILNRRFAGARAAGAAMSSQNQRSPVKRQLTTPAPLPKVLYKYLPRRYAESLVGVGNTQIGTLHDFRRLELGPGIADANEGRKELRASFVEAETFAHGTPSGEALNELGVIKVTGGASVTFSDVTIVRGIDHPNAYIWCCSTDMSEEAMSGLDGADTCVEIFDVDGFFKALHAAVSSLTAVQLIGVAPVTYSTRSEEWSRQNLGLHAAYLKGIEYKRQGEVRAVWTVDNDPTTLQPLIIPESNIGKYCHIVDISVSG